MELGLTGKTAVVTGASKGIGNAIAHRLASEGANLAVCARTPGPLEDAAVEIETRHGVQCQPVPTDLTDRDETVAFVETVVDQYGGIDVLVNNAGKAVAGSLDELDEDDWQTTIDLKMMGLVRTTTEAMPYLVDGGGAVVNNIGNDGTKPSPTELSPGAVCAANINFTQALAKQYGREGVRVNCVNPGPVATTLWSSFVEGVGDRLGVTTEEASAIVENSLPLGRIAEPGEVANVVTFLASDAASFVNGAVVDVDGGQEKSLLEYDNIRRVNEILE